MPAVQAGRQVNRPGFYGNNVQAPADVLAKVVAAIRETGGAFVKPLDGIERSLFQGRDNAVRNRNG